MFILNKNMYMLNSSVRIVILFFSILLFLNSCKNEGIKKDDLKIGKQNNNNVEIEKKENIFLIKYDSIKKTKSRSFEVLTDNFFNDKNPNIKYYALFCNFCLYENKDESLSEEFSLNVFELFKESKEKRNILIKYIYQLKEKERDAILSSTVRLMCLDLGDNGYDIEKFDTDFNALSKNGEVQKSVKKCLDDVVL